MECINNTFDPMKVRNLSTVGVSGGWVFSAYVMVLYEVFWSDQFEFVALFMVLVLIRCVFQMLFFESCGCF